MLDSCKLALNFDPKQLQADLEQIEPLEWVAHFNTGYYVGEWSGVALRSVGGLSTKLYPDPNSEGEVEDTAILGRCPNIRCVLATFKCPVRSARLLKLGANATIKEHRDYDLGFAVGEIRMHVPIITNRDVEFYLAGMKVEMKEGECWYLDFNLPHSVKNNGATDRVHLVIDCVVNDWLRELLRIGETQAPKNDAATSSTEASSPPEFERFRQFVLHDPALQQRLRQTEDRHSFFKLAVALGQECGYRFSPKDVEDAMRSERRAWMERWLE